LEEYTIRNQYKEQEATEFEHLIAAVGADQGWEITPIGNKDAQELADEELALQPEIADEDSSDEELLPPRRHRAPPDNNNNELCSSPIGSDDYDLAFGLFSQCHGDVRLDSRAGLEEARKAMSHGSPEEFRFRAVTKEYIRAAAAVATFRNNADKRNHTTEGATEGAIEGATEGATERATEEQYYGLEDLFSTQGDSGYFYDF
jgi:hypothetical protein